MGLRGGRKHHQGRFVEKAIIDSNVEGSTDPREQGGVKRMPGIQRS